MIETGRSKAQLVNFLQEELSVSAASMALALRRCEQQSGSLPIILWQYGFISLEQLEQVFDWLASSPI
uniref:DUF2949 domain-containing protein n=1 Tax=Trichocoleus desertorum TaxID=1481672 RepID=UPI0025B28A7B|nr:DUF2949 domain-containing protein [Trichocoleus desertorum]